MTELGSIRANWSWPGWRSPSRFSAEPREGGPQYRTGLNSKESLGKKGVIGRSRAERSGDGNSWEEVSAVGESG